MPATDPVHRTLRVTLVQRAASLDPEVNRVALSELCPPERDLVVFPEAFARDFGPTDQRLVDYAEPLDGPFATEVSLVAEKHGTTIVAGMFELADDPERPYNTLLMRGQAEAAYRKIHLYDSFGYQESARLLPGQLAPATVCLGETTIGLMTCYDLRFPELARGLIDAGAEVIVISAAWLAGERKVDHWRTLVTARAIENTCWMIAVDQPGPAYSGHSMVVSPLGDVVAEAGVEAEVLNVDIDVAAVAAARELNPSLANRRM